MSHQLTTRQVRTEIISLLSFLCFYQHNFELWLILHFELLIEITADSDSIERCAIPNRYGRHGSWKSGQLWFPFLVLQYHAGYVGLRYRLVRFYYQFDLENTFLFALSFIKSFSDIIWLIALLKRKMIYKFGKILNKRVCLSIFDIVKTL